MTVDNEKEFKEMLLEQTPTHIYCKETLSHILWAFQSNFYDEKKSEKVWNEFFSIFYLISCIYLRNAGEENLIKANKGGEIFLILPHNFTLSSDAFCARW